METDKLDVQIGCLKTLLAMRAGGQDFMDMCHTLLLASEHRRKQYRMIEKRDFREKVVNVHNQVGQLLHELDSDEEDEGMRHRKRTRRH